MEVVVTNVSMKRVLLVALVLGGTGCGAAVAPQELHSARDTLSKAETTEAPKVAPVKLEEAKQALAAADAAFTNGEDEAEVKTLSHIAVRRAEIAVAAANKIVADKEVEQAEKDRLELSSDALDSTQKRLSKTEEEARRKATELAEERKARKAAEKKAAAALASLHEIAKVKEESRGVVITLSGSVLFATGKYHLLPIAKEKLNEVAQALKDQGYKKLVVEGHTDSRGSDTKNQELSLLRAQEVRSHLVSQGIESAKIEAAGRGEVSPVADNSTAEGRANNRRVEIVVTPE